MAVAQEERKNEFLSGADLVVAAILLSSLAVLALEVRSEISVQGTRFFTKNGINNGIHNRATKSGGFLVGSDETFAKAYGTVMFIRAAKDISIGQVGRSLANHSSFHSPDLKSVGQIADTLGSYRTAIFAVRLRYLPSRGKPLPVCIRVERSDGMVHRIWTG